MCGMSFPSWCSRCRLKQAVVEGPRTFQEGTQDDLPSDTLSQSFIQDSQQAYQTYQDAVSTTAGTVDSLLWVWEERESMLKLKPFCRLWVPCFSC